MLIETVGFYLYLLTYSWQNLFLWASKVSPRYNVKTCPAYRKNFRSTLRPVRHDLTHSPPRCDKSSQYACATAFLRALSSSSLSTEAWMAVRQERRALSWRGRKTRVFLKRREKTTYVITGRPRKERNLRNGSTPRTERKAHAEASREAFPGRHFVRESRPDRKWKFFPPNPYLEVDWGKSRLFGERCCLETNACGEFL